MRRSFFVAAILSSVLALQAVGQETPQSERGATERRQEMAKMHEQMAACLRSDKPLSECRSEMMQSCHGMGGEECPMMGAMGPKDGRGRKRSSKESTQEKGAG